MRSCSITYGSITVACDLSYRVGLSYVADRLVVDDSRILLVSNVGDIGRAGDIIAYCYPPFVFCLLYVCSYVVLYLFCEREIIIKSTMLDDVIPTRQVRVMIPLISF